MKKWERFTRQEIEQFTLESNSYAELARKCGYSGKAGSNIKEMHLMITQLDLNILHFTGKRSQKGKTYQTDRYIPFKEYIKGEHVQTNKLRKKLLREGLKKHICECCLNTMWNNVPIPLEVHHKDGDKDNNDIDNLELLCPNCHALTDTYKGKNTKKHKHNVSN